MKKLIIHFWKGDIKLWKSYWLIGELLNALVYLLFINIEIRFFNNIKISNSLPFFNFDSVSIITKILLIFWTLFITVGIWRSAEKYQGSIFWIFITLIFLSYRIFSMRIIFF